MTTNRHLPARRLVGLLAALSMTAVLAACSGGTDSSGDSAGADRAFSESAESAEPESESESADRATSMSGARDTSTTSTTKRPNLERAVISKGTVSLVADDVRTARQDVQRVLDAKGGTISEEEGESDDDGDLVYTRLVVRVPAKSFASTMTALESVAEFRTSHRGSEDVTTEVIDTEVRVRAQEASLRRVETLLARADSLKDIIWIESQLTQRQAELDSLKSQQAWLTDQTTLSTITIDIAAKPQEAEPRKDTDDGFLAGLKDGWSALSATATTLATIVGALLPFAVVVLILGAPVWLLVRRGRARRVEPAVDH